MASERERLKHSNVKIWRRYYHVLVIKRMYKKRYLYVRWGIKLGSLTGEVIV